MLIYNFRKEFVGIDEAYLKQFGLSNLSELLVEASDFADLFVKTPGFIHNFKHVHWIDFVECAQSEDEANVVINVNSKTFQATLEVQSAFLSDSPTQKAYLISLNNLRELSRSQVEQISKDIPVSKITSASKPVSPVVTPTIETPAPEVAPVIQPNIIADPYEKDDTPTIVDAFDNDTPISLDFDDEPEDIDTLAHDDFKLDIDIDDTPPATEVKEVAKVDEVVEFEPKPTLIEEEEDLEFDNSYVYDPKVASDELGLPLDLIEEFIEDFIAQAKEFREPIYKAFEEGDKDQVKVLSHKLKGVAANLRIEDAFEVLTTINTSEDQDEIKINLSRLYKIIAKLSGEEVVAQPAQPMPNAQSQAEMLADKELDDDEFVISFKDDEAVDIPAVKEAPVVEETAVAQTSSVVEDSPVVNKIIYDKNTVSNEIGLDKNSFEELFGDFVQESKDVVAKIKNSIRQNNPKSWKKSALELKGMSDNMRIDDLQDDLLALIETQDVDVAKGAVLRLQTSLENISNL